ncbi:hypothetical protein AGR7A_pAt20348 [Agrobacterium deltaense NCPPB 1641]|uniref:Uncharacterized protein n=1 Tax=Agrobacterium deltaense NCPPB 1641 TaxID=1183425 RepID=A0A1S7U9Y6_9HYPH|nr:hypothetical protein AGR7A_pAt20348 [Agrobacterium deltaense NCPPB 1641]
MRKADVYTTTMQWEETNGVFIDLSMKALNRSALPTTRPQPETCSSAASKCRVVWIN